MPILNTVENTINSIKKLYDNMENDIEYMCNTLNNLITDNKLYGYEFTRLGGEQNTSLFLYHKSKFKYVNLGKSLTENDNFKELTEEAKLIAVEFNQYMHVVLDSTLLKEKLIQVAPYSDIVTRASLKKSIKIK